MTGHVERRSRATPVELRAVTPDEWELWRVIRLEALAQAPDAFGSKLADWERAPEQRWRARLELEDSCNFVAFTGRSPVGMATGIPGDQPGTAELISMYVSDSVRGRGVGSALIEAVESWARERGAETLCLAVVAANIAARRLYERHGLAVAGELTRDSSDDPLELRMCKALAAE